MYKYLFYIILIHLFFLIFTGCFLRHTTFKEGFIVFPDNTQYEGYIKIDSCEGSFVHYKQTQHDTAKRFPFSKIKTAVTGNDSFIVIEKRGVKDITTRYYNFKDDIIIKVIEDGLLTLYKHYIVDYRRTYFRTEKFILHGYIISKKGTEKIYRIPFEPDEFLRVAKMFFSDNPELMAEINGTEFVKEIVHAETGEKFTYKSVSVEHILNFVRKYNQRAKNLNKE